jgi:hypothetical protein
MAWSPEIIWRLGVLAFQVIVLVEQSATNGMASDQVRLLDELACQPSTPVIIIGNTPDNLGSDR